VAVDSQLRLWIERSLAKTIVDGLPTLKVQSPGNRVDVSAEEDWVAFHPLSIPKHRSRKGTWHGQVQFQVSIYSRYGEVRSDRRIDKLFEHAAAVRVLLEKTGIIIKRYGSDDVEVGSLSIGDGDEVYMDESELGLGARFPNATEVSNVHSVVITFIGTMFVS